MFTTLRSPAARAALPAVAVIAAAALIVAATMASGAPAPAQAPVGTPLKLKIPLGLEDPPIPDDNPLTVEKVALGKQLYFDRRLSADGTVSCATCHDPSKGWSDGLPTSAGIRGQKGARNSPTIVNSAYGLFQFWDGRAATLEEQALGPIENPIEMGEKLDNVVKKLNAVAGYREQFRKVFGTEVTKEGIAKAIASFERTILSGDSPFDRYEKGDKSAMTPAAVRGYEIFRTAKGNCTSCHVGFNLSDSVFHNLGVGAGAKEPDLGREKTTKDSKDRGAFKTPILRDLTKSAPYMHDGSEPTLESVVELYVRGGTKNPNLDAKMKPLTLTAQEKVDLVSFLKALDGKPPEIAPPALP